ncbi:MAG: hypothetical protein ABL927_03325, partial [Bdellovibrionales bacterium]
VSPGDPTSIYPNSQGPYVIQTIQGRSYDKFGDKVLTTSNDAHIPLDEYKFVNFWGNHGEK